MAFAPTPRPIAPKPSRMPLIAGGAVAAVAVIGVGAVMLMNQATPTTAVPAASGLAIETQAPVAPPLSSSTPLAVLPDTGQAVTTPATPPAAAPVQQASAAPAPKAAVDPAPQVRIPAAVSPPPVLAVETAPLVVPEPTPIPIAPAGPPPPAAERPSTDPSAPMTTRLPDGTE